MSIFSFERYVAKAKESYNECEAIIIEMANIIKSVHPTFSTDIALGQFDLVLQACLLSTAVADGEFLKSERCYILEIARHTDILTLVNKEGRAKNEEWQDIAWTDLESFNEESLKRLSAIASCVVKDYANEFVQYFATVDKVIEGKDYKTLLFNSAGMIIAVMSGVDGDDLEDELPRIETAAGVRTYMTLIDKPWQEVLHS